MSSSADQRSDKSMSLISESSSCDSTTTSASSVSLSTPNLNTTSSISPAADTLAALREIPPSLQRDRTNGSRRPLVHSVSIIVEPVADADDDVEDQITPSISQERRNTIAGPIVLLEDFGFEPPRKASQEDDIVQSIIANARLRKEEFARLLEEHAQIVSEINRAETSLL